MSDLPPFVHICEEGPREGFQSEARIISTADKIRFIDALAQTGVSVVNCVSFVSPKRVPQMADAAELFGAIRKRPGVRYTALWLNEAGYRRARAVPQVDPVGTLHYYASDAFARANNGRGADEMAALQRDWLRRYRADGVAVEAAYVMTAFGCNLEGEISEATLSRVLAGLAAMLRDEGASLPKVYLADTVGWANPRAVRRRVDLVRQHLPGVRVGLHLHDTRGIGMANAWAALEHGVDLFDASVAGLGGCPFSGHADGSAAGNICTEDLAFLCAESGIDTGIELERLLHAARLAERIVGRRLDGKLMHAGTLQTLRARGPAP